MTIIKRSGKVEEFSPEKLMNSIASASDEAQSPLNESDLKSVLSEFRQIVAGKTEIKTAHIDTIICGILYTRGYLNVLKKYAEYKKCNT